MPIIDGSIHRVHSPALVSVIFKDMMKFKNVLFFLLISLIIVVICVSASLVTVTRQCVIDINQEIKKQEKFDDEAMHLRLEIQTLTEHSRIMDLSKRKLDMHQPDPTSEEVVVNLSPEGQH